MAPHAIVPYRQRHDIIDGIKEAKIPSRLRREMMEHKIWEGEDVMTSDDVRLGVARALHYRPPAEVNPDEQLYAVYLEVVNYELGDDLFVPTDFLLARDDTDEPVLLTVPVKFVMHRAWSRAPDFVAKRLGREERLQARVIE